MNKQSATNRYSVPVRPDRFQNIIPVNLLFRNAFIISPPSVSFGPHPCEQMWFYLSLAAGRIASNVNLMPDRFLVGTWLLGMIFLLASCSTYYIPVKSFQQQVSGFDSTTMREVTTRGPLGELVTYRSYPIDTIHAFDKSGHPVSIPNSPSIEVRITDTANRKAIFYFDLVQFDGQNIIGRQSRLVSSLTKTIPISAVKRIEIQNGRKNFRYVQ